MDKMEAQEERDQISYTMQELEEWMQAGLVPKKIGRRILKRFAKSCQLHAQAMILKDTGFSQEEVLAFFRVFLPKTSIKKIRRDLKDIRFFSINREKLLSQSSSNEISSLEESVPSASSDEA